MSTTRGLVWAGWWIGVGLLAGCSSSPDPATDAAVADTPTTDTPTADAGTAPTAIDAIIRMCRMNNACGYQTRFFMPADQCTHRALDLLAGRAETDPPEHRLHFARMVQCAQSATTCDAYVRCADFDVACSGSATPMCMGTVRVACSTPGGNHQPRTFDCALLGGQCTNGECVYPAGGTVCTSFGGGRCDGTTRRWCRRTTAGDMAELTDPCPAGTACVPSSGGASCYPLGSCTGPASSRCDGDTVVNCLPMGGSFAELRQDCALAGRRCELVGGRTATCVPRATECMGASRTVPTTSTCDGANVRVCIEGRDVRIDCAAVGRTSCQMLPALAGIPARGVCM